MQIPSFPNYAQKSDSFKMYYMNPKLGIQLNWRR